MATERAFSFAEIVQGREAHARVTDDDKFFAVELVMIMSGKTLFYNDSANDFFPISKFYLLILFGRKEQE
jgi:hypothetical protein